MPTGLFRRSGRYYTRRVIPLTLQEHYGRREIVKALGTSEPSVARRLHYKLWSSLDDEFAKVTAEVLESRCGAVRPPAAPDIHNLSVRVLAALRRRREVEASAGTLTDFMQAQKWSLEVDQAVMDGDFDPVLTVAAHEAHRNARRALLTGEGAFGLVEEKNQTVSDREGPTLTAVINQWIFHRSPQPKTVDKARRMAMEFESVVGKMAITAISRDHVLAYRAHLAASDCSTATGNNKLNQLRTLTRFARNNAIIAEDPCDGIKIDGKKQGGAPRIAYDTQALSAVFSSPVYEDDQRPTGGAGDAAYWLPIIALYSGARLNELGQLRPKDIVKEPYIGAGDVEQAAWVIRIVADEKDGLRLKTKSSERRVPIHPELERLGFLRFVAVAVANSQVRLFPRLKPDKYGNVTAQWSKWFGRYLRNICKVVDERITFHSFRHTFKHYARHSELAPDVQNEITGHETGDVGDAYGGLSYPLKPLVEGMNRYRIPGFKPPAAPPSFRN